MTSEPVTVEDIHQFMHAVGVMLDTYVANVQSAFQKLAEAAAEMKVEI